MHKVKHVAITNDFFFITVLGSSLVCHKLL